ncbi:MAG TPA: YgiT-type zinc finger protein [Thermoanaerobaculia bacterium]|jgi:YgiT-type zinc finger domain-containing protein|nr:YgiT-type zinc finger protein [Thermoanaerobaculia bacterium]
MKWPFDKCPLCGGELVDRIVEKLLRGGVDTAVLKVQAEVCARCAGRIYTQKAIRQFEAVRARLEKKETAGLQPVGRTFHVL